MTVETGIVEESRIKEGKRVICPGVVSKVNVYTFRIFLETAKAMGEVRWVKGGMLGRICDNM